MANYTIRMYSNMLRRPTTFQMVIPNDERLDFPAPENPYKKRPMKVLFLLHGYTGDAGNWVPEELANKYNFAIVAPNGENSFWLDAEATGHQFASFVGVELIEYIRKTFGLAMKPEDTFVCGMSMGGFGALHTGLMFPETFGKIGAMSSALIVHQVASMEEGADNGMANYAYYAGCFGVPGKVLASRHNPETLVDELLQRKQKFPEIYMCCGTEDFLLENNREFHAFLEDRKVAHVYMESAGIHDMNFWNEYTLKIIDWMFLDENN